MKDLNIKVCTPFLCVVFILISSCANDTNHEKTSRVKTLPFYEEATFMPHWLEPGSKDVEEFHQISDFHLYNQDGDIITHKSLDNKIYVADFFFATCPGICPQMTDNMKILQEEFLDDDAVMLVSHTVTPERDTIAALKEYANLKGINSEKWHLLTGDRDQIYKLGRQDYFIEEDLGLDKEADDFLHTENFVLIDKNRNLRGIYNGLKTNDIQQIIADIHTLKKETKRVIKASLSLNYKS